MRRVFLIGSILYFLRSITMYVTVLPVSSTTYYCSPKSNHTEPLEIAKRVVQLMSGFGLSINGKHTYCGDFIYSGHTVSLVLGYLTICECNYPRLFVLFSFCSIVVTAHILFGIVHCAYVPVRFPLNFRPFRPYRYAAPILSAAVGVVAHSDCGRIFSVISTRSLHHRHFDCILHNNAAVLDISHIDK